MTLTEEDKKFLDEVGKQLPISIEDYKIAPFNADVVRADYVRLCPILDQLPVELPWWVESIFAHSPAVASGGEKIREEVAMVVKLSIAHGFIRAWQTRDFND